MLFRQAHNLVKTYALGAHKVRLHVLNQDFEVLTNTQYPLSVLPWTSFSPRTSHIHFGVPGSDSFTPVDPARPVASLPVANPPPPTLFSVPLKELTPLPASIPAILAYLAMRAHERNATLPSDTNSDLVGILTGIDAIYGPHLQFMIDPGSTDANGAFLAFSAGTSEQLQDKRWEYEWARALPVEPTIANINPTLTFRPGSLEGYWEGVFSVSSFSLHCCLMH